MAQVRPRDVLYDEILEHAVQCQTLSERFFARDDIIEKVIIFCLVPYPARTQQVRAFILSNVPHPCTIFGKSGSGKSSVMAQIAIKVNEWLR